jgi:hypothetical protein
LDSLSAFLSLFAGFEISGFLSLFCSILRIHEGLPRLRHRIILWIDRLMNVSGGLTSIMTLYTVLSRKLILFNWYAVYVATKGLEGRGFSIRGSHIGSWVPGPSWGVALARAALLIHHNSWHKKFSRTHLQL